MRILGIDPGSRKTGWAIVEVDGRKIKYVASGILKFEHLNNFLDRLGYIYKSCDELQKEFLPDEVAIESLIYVKSVEALSKLAQARGAIIAALMKDRMEKITEYSPNLIKSSITGHGHADKLAVEKSLTLMFGKLKFKSSDESDALAIAVCHALQVPMRQKLQNKSKEVNL